MRTIKKSEDGRSVQVLKTLTKTTPEQKKLEAENLILRDVLCNLSGYIFKIRMRCELGQYPTDKKEADQAISEILRIRETIDAQLNVTSDPGAGGDNPATE